MLNSVAHMTMAAGLRRCSGNMVVGPSASAIDRDFAARNALPAQASSSSADSSGSCTSRNAPSISAANADRRVETALVQFAAQFDEAGDREIGDAATW